MQLPENIDINNAGQYNLYIRVQPNALLFITQEINNRDKFTISEVKLSKDKTLLVDFKQIIYDYPVLAENFNQVNIVFVTSDYQLIPNIYYDKKSVKDIYHFTHSNKSTHVITCEQDLSECKTIFGINEEIYLYLKRSLYDPSFFHHSSLVSDYFKIKIKGKKQNSMFINYHNNLLDVICFDKNERIVYSHTYKNEQEENLLYYTLSVWEKCGFDQYKDLLFIYGYAPSNGLEQLLKKYIENVSNIGLFDPITDFGEKAQTIPLDILNLLK